MTSAISIMSCVVPIIFVTKGLSGTSYHNLSRLGPQARQPSETFDRWLHASLEGGGGVVGWPRLCGDQGRLGHIMSHDLTHRGAFNRK